MSATMPRMAKRKTKPETAEKPAAVNSTKPVRVQEDLAFKLDVISKAFKQDISDILSPEIRPFVERKYDEALARLAEMRRPAGK